jgi:hypothetical protein
MFRYIDDVLSMNNFKFDDFVDRIYPIVIMSWWRPYNFEVMTSTLPGEPLVQ